MTDPAWEPPLVGTDVEHVVGTLERLRATFRWKAGDLDIDQLRRRSVPSSELSLGGLLKHLAACEDDVFSWRMCGEPPAVWASVPEDNIEGWQWTVGSDETADELYETWADAVGRSRATLTRLLDDGDLDQRGHLDYGGERACLRRHLHDLIEEYGRHTGHADLLREAIDGRVGEDPPRDWPMIPAPLTSAP